MKQQPSLTIVRRIKATPEKLFEAWTRSQLIAQWWGPDAGPVLLAETDPRVGGRFRIVFQTLDGQQHDCRGEYLEIEHDRRLVFTWEWVSTPERRSIASVELLPVDDGTELTFTHARFADVPARDAHLRGWNAQLDKLEKIFAISRKGGACRDMRS